MLMYRRPEFLSELQIFVFIMERATADLNGTGTVNWLAEQAGRKRGIYCANMSSGKSIKAWA